MPSGSGATSGAGVLGGAIGGACDMGAPPILSNIDARKQRDGLASLERVGDLITYYPCADLSTPVFVRARIWRPSPQSSGRSGTVARIWDVWVSPAEVGGILRPRVGDIVEFLLEQYDAVPGRARVSAIFTDSSRAFWHLGVRP